MTILDNGRTSVRTREGGIFEHSWVPGGGAARDAPHPYAVMGKYSGTRDLLYCGPHGDYFVATEASIRERHQRYHAQQWGRQR